MLFGPRFFGGTLFFDLFNVGDLVEDFHGCGVVAHGLLLFFFRQFGVSLEVVFLLLGLLLFLSLLPLQEPLLSPIKHIMLMQNGVSEFCFEVTVVKKVADPWSEKPIFENFIDVWAFCGVLNYKLTDQIS